jgi:hypothetical protein
MKLSDDKFLENAIPKMMAAVKKMAADFGKNPADINFAYTVVDKKIEGDKATLKIKDANGNESEIKCVKEGGAWKFADMPKSKIQM